VRLLAVHETAEEEVIYPDIHSEPGGDEVADARVRDEREAKRMVSDLERVDLDSDEFSPASRLIRGWDMAGLLITCGHEERRDRCSRQRSRRCSSRCFPAGSWRERRPPGVRLVGGHQGRPGAVQGQI
jgi:hypothetical protein